ncbi:hypothetical protein IEQ34_021838 [Dendrobium chrysotoxum]|uniref:Pentatricopeptide repeat-containing protein n=1 Tax=Dendrobium chrysotoxum TaxID=161865 RepID=A0AAV7FXC7_DENCH|nr:hypothetical protein IEQ34_021838 [Dendrobium chrysotoxum]
MEHYACGVDLFGRAGNLTETKDLIESISFKPDSMVWMTLLGACKILGDMNLASHIAKSLLESEPTVHSTYVILSSMYAGFGYWDGRAMIQRARDEDNVEEWHSSYEKSNSMLFGRDSLLKAVATNIENKIFDPEVCYLPPDNVPRRSRAFLTQGENDAEHFKLKVFLRISYLVCYKFF